MHYNLQIPTEENTNGQPSTDNDSAAKTDEKPANAALKKAGKGGAAAASNSLNSPKLITNMKKAAANGAAAAKKAVTANGTAAGATNGKAASNGTTDKDVKLKSPNLVKDLKKKGDDKENIAGMCLYQFNGYRIQVDILPGEIDYIYWSVCSYSSSEEDGVKGVKGVQLFQPTASFTLLQNMIICYKIQEIMNPLLYSSLRLRKKIYQ